MIAADLPVPDEALNMGRVKPNPRMPVRHDTVGGWHYHVPGDPLMDAGEQCPRADELEQARTETT